MTGPNQRSRWSFSLAITDDGRGGRLFLENRPRFTFEDRPDNRIHLVRPGETLHTIAIDEFSGATDRPEVYWWVIADYNDITDPTRVLEAGRQLTIPSEDKIADWFSAPDRVS